jgi:ribosome-binding protein aMBF1 (putative translation factor)
MAWARDQKQKARDRAFSEWKARVLGAPEQFSRLKVERTRQGITQRDLAAKVHMHKVTIARMEVGDSPGTANSRARLAFTLGVDLAELFPQ